MIDISRPESARRPAAGASLPMVARSWWTAVLLFALSALVFALFVRVTLYGRVELMGVGPKGLLVPAGLVAALVVWYAAASRLMPGGSSALGGYRDLLVAGSFLPMLATLPIIAAVLGSEAFAREYWIDRSLKVELLLGLPAVTLLLHAGLWTWARRQLTWGRAGPVLLVLAAGFALRFWGMGWGLPFAYQPEETSIYVRWAIEASLHGQWDPHYFQNPSLLIYMITFEFLGLFGLARVLQFGQDPGDLYMVFRGEQDLFYSVARLNSVVLGVATLFVVYLIGRRLWNERAGVMAAAILAVSFLHVRNSQYAVNDVPSTFFLVLSLFYSLRIAEKGRWRDYLLAGLMAGLAASTKYNAGLVVVAVPIAHWVHAGRPSVALSRGPLVGLLFAEVAAIVGFLLGTPYALLNLPLFQDGFLEQLSMGGAPWSGQSLAPTLWQFLTGLVQSAGLAAAVLALGGIYLLLARDRRRGVVLLSFPFCYLAFMSAMNLFFVRWVVPATPFVALLAACALEEILVRVQRPVEGERKEMGMDLGTPQTAPGALGAQASRLPDLRARCPRSRPLLPLTLGEGRGEGWSAPNPTQNSELKTHNSSLARWAQIAAVVLVLLQPALFSLRLDWLVQQTDTREEANAWAARNLPEGSKVAMESFSLLDQESLAFRATLRQVDIELVWRATMHDLNFYRRNGYDYLAISSFNFDRAYSQPDRYADRVEFYNQLDRELPLLAVFSPRADGKSTPFALDDMDTPFWHLFSYDRPGPTVKVYRISG